MGDRGATSYAYSGETTEWEVSNRAWGEEEEEGMSVPPQGEKTGACAVFGVTDRVLAYSRHG